MAGIAPRLPLRPGSDEGYELIKSYEELSRQNLKMLLLTVPGERMMHPDFGVGLRTFLFERNNHITYGAIESRIRSQVTTYLPYIKITGVNFRKPSNIEMFDHAVNIEINYFVAPLGIASTLEVLVDSTGDPIDPCLRLGIC